MQTACVATCQRRGHPALCSVLKRILRFGIILYGFKLTFQDVTSVGLPAIIIDAIVVTVTILLGLFVGRLLKMDRSIALLTACGSAICGAAAVMGVDGAIRPKPYKTAVAVATVVIFGTLSMFLYPVLYRSGVFDLPAQQMVFRRFYHSRSSPCGGSWQCNGSRN